MSWLAWVVIGLGLAAFAAAILATLARTGMDRDGDAKDL